MEHSIQVNKVLDDRLSVDYKKAGNLYKHRSNRLSCPVSSTHTAATDNFHGESILAQICSINKRLNNKIQVPTNEVKKYTIINSLTAILYEVY